MLKDNQTYFKNRDFQSMFGHFSTLLMEELFHSVSTLAQIKQNNRKH